MNLLPSDYEQKRREAVAARRRGLAKYLPETACDPRLHMSEIPPRKTNAFSATLPVFICILTPVLFALFLFLHKFPTPTGDVGSIAAPILLEAEVPPPDNDPGNDVTAWGILEESEVYNILLLGNDSRTDSLTERTDAMILVSINPSAKRIYLTSFLRDLYVPIPGHGKQRLNAANPLGGPDLTVEAVERNFGISIHNYAQVNFTAFESIIDTLGGVELYLTSAEAAYLDLGQTGGTYLLSGEDALAYCRIRSLDSDFIRTERQRYLLETLWADLQDVSPGDATKLLELILPQVQTDVTWADGLNLLSITGETADYEIISHSIPAPGTYEISMVRDMSVIVADLEENSAMLRTTLYGK